MMVTTTRLPAPWKLFSTLGLVLLGLHFYADEKSLVRAAAVLLALGAWIAPPRAWWPAIVIMAVPWIMAVLTYVFTVWGAIVLEPDSGSYLSDHASRSPGIFWIASALKAVFGSLNAFAALQGLAVAGAGVLGGLAMFHALRETTGSRGAFLLGGTLSVFVAASEQVWAVSPKVMTEALTTAGLLASLSLLFIALRRADEGKPFFWLVALAATAMGSRSSSEPPRSSPLPFSSCSWSG